MGGAKVSPTGAPRILFSVITPSEAVQIKSIADVVDVKNPAKGPLGAPDIFVVAEVVKEVGGAAPVSASLGDAETGDMTGHIALAKAFANEGVSIIKIAVSHLSTTQAEHLLSTLRKSLPADVKIAAAVYADVTERGFLSILQDISRRSGVDGILLDTAVKNGKSLFSHISPAQIRRVIESARSSALFCALAGGLEFEDMEDLAALNPDYAGFRSAIASNGRGAAGVDTEKARKIKERLIATADRR